MSSEHDNPYCVFEFVSPYRVMKKVQYGYWIRRYILKRKSGGFEVWSKTILGEPVYHSTWKNMHDFECIYYANDPEKFRYISPPPKLI